MLDHTAALEIKTENKGKLIDPTENNTIHKFPFSRILATKCSILQLPETKKSVWKRKSYCLGESFSFSLFLKYFIVCVRLNILFLFDSV